MAEWKEALSDEQLYEEAAFGDKKSAQAVFGRYKKRLYNLALRMVGDAEVAEKFVLDAFLNVLRTRRLGLEENHFKVWLYAIILNSCRRHIRRVRKRAEAAEEERRESETAGEVPAEAVPTAEPSSSEELLAALKAVIVDLPERQEETIILSKYEGLSCEEISHLLGISAGAVKALMFRAMEALRKRMREKS